MNLQADYRSGFLVMARLVVVLMLSICHCQGQESAFRFMEKNRRFQPNPGVVDNGKPGLVVSESDGRNIHLKEIMKAARTYSPRDGRDLAVLFGYLFDSEMHMRCLSYVILASDLKLPDRIPPIRTLSKVGSTDFEEMSLSILTAIDRKRGLGDTN